MKKGTIILIAVLVILLGGGSFAYQALKGAQTDTAQTSEESQTTSDSAADGAQDNAQSAPPKIPARNFTVFNAAGEQVSFESFIGQPSVVNFWASWCGYCVAEMPDFQKVYEEYKDTDLNFMMINATDGQMETRAKGEQFIEENGYSFPVYYDEAISGRDGLTISDSANAVYGISGLPSTLFIDREGNVVGLYSGVMDEARLKKVIEFIMDDANIGKSLADALS